MQTSQVLGYFLAFAASHCAWVISTKPLPLQEFWPLQELLAVLHDDWPLHELTPSQWTFASSAEAVVIDATLNSRAAAVAMAVPETDLDINIVKFLVLVSGRTRSTDCPLIPHGQRPGPDRSYYIRLQNSKQYPFARGHIHAQCPF